MSTHETKGEPRRRIIVCCDGTAHSAIKGHDLNPYTNVLRLSRCIKARDSDGNPQIVGYVPGIGTSVGNPVNTYLQGTGIGIDEKIKEAYNFICHNYDVVDQNNIVAKENVEISLIGFSRGAFVARCVADLINKVGILTKMGIHYLPFIYDLWQQGEDFRTPQHGTVTSRPESPANEMNRKQFKEDLSSILDNKEYVHRNVHIKVCAVWDTVASIGLVSTHLSIFRHLRSRKLSFVDSNLCDCIDHAIQALSLHEHRRPFSPVVWKFPNEAADRERSGKLRLQQCWFMGYHSDIGGGVRGEGLAHFPLAWMMSKLEAFIEFDIASFWNPRPIETKWKTDEKNGGRIQIDVKDSMSMRYWLAGSYHREPGTPPKPQTNLQPKEGTSNEEKPCDTFHFTVHLVWKFEVIKLPQVMKHAQYNSRTSRQWDFEVLPPKSYWPRYQKGKSNTGLTYVRSYQIREDDVDEYETRLLEKWINGELDSISEGWGDAEEEETGYEGGLYSFLTIMLSDIRTRRVLSSTTNVNVR
ncbi:hypothetical protein F5Y14DRAFT_437743 [Nemania sp. NC0429]|nr:hypothetical protein F5Y14DRAFT_437743 [Nemania sp. NC0429]